MPASLFTTSACTCFHKTKFASTESISKYATGVCCHLEAVSGPVRAGVTEAALFFLLKKRKNRTATPINRTILRASKPLFMQVFWQVNQSLLGKYNHSGHFR